ncbi:MULTISPECIES: hydrogenase maturation protease [Streptomyces]|uniref:Hydrogenase maturation protease n=2 Tax=Streptomyces bottropensis TaxID=42235 RepID=M3FXU7_9ACTN|nr:MULTISPECIES: hydrogenase maturation protease [Streptomyces]EMF57074.1 hydrogenase maturation protease [Streptomyces bottropensis ATCC 25435]MZD20390.1 hydrogenase maturation protease [Streptomyces sp. SID5476]
MTHSAAHLDTLDDVSECGLLVVGCGNLLRADDGVGPILVRHLWEGGVPAGVRLVDGGTAGMDVAFQMRGAERVIIVDACRSEAEPGTVFKVPGPAVEELPPLSGLHTHSFRWDNALAFAHWLLGTDYPSDVTVYLIEARDFTPGGLLSAEVEEGMRRVLGLIRRDSAFRQVGQVQVEFTDDGYVRLDAACAREYFPGDAAVVLAKEGEVWLTPLRGTASGGLLLKQRNIAGDRTLLVREALADDVPVGVRQGWWDEQHGALRISRD